MADLWNYDPSWRDRVATGLLGMGMPRSSVVGLMGSAGLGEEGPLMGGGLLDLTPAGVPFWMNEAARTAGTPEGTLRAMALVPGAKPLGKALGKGARTAARSVDDLMRAAKEMGVDLSISQRGNQITVNKIVVPKGSRNQGLGSEVMRQVVDFADANQKTVALTPTSDFGGSKARLKGFYGRFGFEPNAGRTRDYEIMDAMRRYPRSRTGGGF